MAQIEAEILRLTGERGPAKSVDPGEVARLFGAVWQRQLPAVRKAAIRLARAGRIDILRHGKPADPDDIKGVIRLRIRPPESAA